MDRCWNRNGFSGVLCDGGDVPAKFAALWPCHAMYPVASLGGQTTFGDTLQGVTPEVRNFFCG